MDSNIYICELKEVKWQEEKETFTTSYMDVFLNESRTSILQFNLEKRGSETLLTTEDQPHAPATV